VAYLKGGNKSVRPLELQDAGSSGSVLTRHDAASATMPSG